MDPGTRSSIETHKITVRKPPGRSIPAITQVTGKLIEHPLDPVDLHLLKGQPVHTGRTPIRQHPLPRLPQHVTSVDTVEQSMETPIRRLLGRSP